MTEEEAFNSFIGGWQLVSFTTTAPGGKVQVPMGSTPIGQIMYSSDGHMTAHLLAAGDLPDPVPHNYVGYFGRFTINADQDIVRHHVVGSSIRGLIGSMQLRHFKFDGKRLILEAELEDSRGRVVWEKRHERS